MVFAINRAAVVQASFSLVLGDRTCLAGSVLQGREDGVLVSRVCRGLLSSCGSGDGVFARSFLVTSPRSSGCSPAPLALRYVQPSRAELQGPFSKKKQLF